MAELGPDVPTYSYLSGVETLRQLPNVQHSSEAAAIRIPSEDKAGDAFELTYGQLQNLVKSTATALLDKIGLEKGDICSIVMPNCVPFILAFLAVPWTRAVSAPLNQNYTEAEYKFYMEDNKSKLLLVPSEGIPATEAAAATLGISVYSVGWCRGTGVTVAHKAGPTRVNVSHESSPEKKLKVAFEPDPSDVALFLHTSGTTAKPKVS